MEDPTARGVKNEKAVIHRGGRPCEGGLTNVFRFRDTSERLMRVTAGRGTVRAYVCVCVLESTCAFSQRSMVQVNHHYLLDIANWG